MPHRRPRRRRRNATHGARDIGAAGRGMSPVRIRPLEPAAYAALAAEGFGPEVFNPNQHHAGELVEAYASVVAIELAATLGVDGDVAAGRTGAAATAAHGFVPTFAP